MNLSSGRISKDQIEFLVLDNQISKKRTIIKWLSWTVENFCNNEKLYLETLYVHYPPIEKRRYIPTPPRLLIPTIKYILNLMT